MLLISNHEIGVKFIFWYVGSSPNKYENLCCTKPMSKWHNAVLGALMTCACILFHIYDSENGFLTYLIKECHKFDAVKKLLGMFRDPQRLQKRDKTKIKLENLIEAQRRLSESLSATGVEFDLGSYLWSYCRVETRITLAGEWSTIMASQLLSH